MSFPYAITPITNRKAVDFLKICNMGTEDMCFVGPKKYVLPKLYEKYAPVYYNLPVRTDDVWMFGFPRSGTTLAQEMIWLIANDCNFEKASEDVLDIRFPFLEADPFSDTYFYDEMEIYARTNNTPEGEIARKLAVPVLKRLETMKQRFVKTHIAISFMNPDILSKTKVFYLARNPRDVVISYYFFTILMLEENKDKVTFEEYWRHFKEGTVIWGPYFEHLKEGWNIRNQKNVMFLIYDKYSKNLRQTFKHVAEFLGKELTVDDIKKLEEHLNIDNFRKNKMVNNQHFTAIFGTYEENHFIRKGGTGGWRDFFKGDLENELEQWIQENLIGYEELFNLFKV